MILNGVGLSDRRRTSVKVGLPRLPDMAHHYTLLLIAALAASAFFCNVNGFEEVQAQLDWQSTVHGSLPGSDLSLMQKQNISC